MRATLLYLLLTALRDRLFFAVLVALALVALAGSFLGDQTVVEAREANAAFVGFATRLVVILGLVLFVAVHVRRIFETREILLLLSRPVSRTRFVLAYFLSFAVIAVLLALPAVLAVAWLAQPPVDALLLWGFSLALEAVLMAAVALFFALELPGVVAAAFATLGFYLLARGTGVLLAIAGSEFRTRASDFATFMDQAATVMGFVLPRLDLFAPTAWLVHGPDAAEPLLLVLAQGIVYTAVMVTAAVIDFRRRRF